MRSLAVAVLLTIAFAGSAAAQSTKGLCVYNGKTYSPNAIICISKSMYQQCVNNKGVMGWADGKTDPQIGCQNSWPDTAR